jgi:hypothetical protein
MSKSLLIRPQNSIDSTPLAHALHSQQLQTTHAMSMAQLSLHTPLTAAYAFHVDCCASCYNINDASMLSHPTPAHARSLFLLAASGMQQSSLPGSQSLHSPNSGDSKKLRSFPISY